MCEEGHSVYVSMLDVKSTFDCVWHEGLFLKLYELGINAKAWRIIRQWYLKRESFVAIIGVLSDRYPLRHFVRQGGVLSMKLYNPYVAGLLKSLNEANLGCVIYDKFVGTPSYADDIALAAVFPRSLQKMIHIADACLSVEIYF